MNTRTSFTLANYTKPEFIIPRLATRTTRSVMQELTGLLHREDSSPPHFSFCGLAALNRELLSSTGLDFGATFPHLRVATLSRPCFALGRSNEPFSWLAPGFRPIDLVFLIIEPLKADAESGQLVSTLQRLGKNRVQLDELRRATTADEILAMLIRIPLVSLSESTPLPALSTAPQNSSGHRTATYRRWRR